jgi:hypothetical protein
MNRSLSPLRNRDDDSDSAASAVAVSDESLVVRNYDVRPHEVTVRFLDADDETAFDRTYELGPGDVVSTPTRLRRGVYRVSARLADGARDARDAADCLVGSGPAETAVVETGNGIVSVAEGVV